MRSIQDKNSEKAIIDRIKSVRLEHAGKRGKSKFARALGISASTYSYYENDRVPPIDVLCKICEVTGVDLQWLVIGQHTKKLEFKQNKGLFEKLNDLLNDNPELKDPIIAFIELLKEKKGIEKKVAFQTKQSTKKRPGWIPVLGRTAAGIVHYWDKDFLPEPSIAITELDDLVKKHTGKTIIGTIDAAVSIDLYAQALLEGVKTQKVSLIQVSDPGDEQVVEFVKCEEIHSLFPDSFALRIDGDSMSPRINDGDIVILSPSVPAAEGHIAIACLTNQIGVTCKLVRTAQEEIHLIPINERYETKVVPKKDLLWAIAVLCHINI